MSYILGGQARAKFEERGIVPCGNLAAANTCVADLSVDDDDPGSDGTGAGPGGHPNGIVKSARESALSGGRGSEMGRATGVSIHPVFGTRG
jgi:hypothetical protein